MAVRLPQSGRAIVWFRYNFIPFAEETMVGRMGLCYHGLCDIPNYRECQVQNTEWGSRTTLMRQRA